MFRQLKWQLILPILIVCVSLMLVFFIASQWMWRDNVEKLSNDTVQKQLQVFAGNIDQLVSSKQERMKLASDAIQQFYTSNQARSLVMEYTKQLMLNHNEQVFTYWWDEATPYQNKDVFFTWWKLTDGQAEFINELEVDVTVGGEFENNPDYDYYWGAVKTGKTFMTAPYEDKDINVWMISISNPVYDAQKRLIGVIGMDMDLSNLKELGDQVKIGEQSQLTLISDSGDVLYHPNSEFVFRKNVKSDFESDWKNSYQVAMSDTRTIQQVKVNEEAFLVVSEKIPSTNWTAVIRLPMETVLSEINRFQNYFTIGFFFLILFIILAVARVVYKRIQQPLNRLIVGVEKVGSGDFAHRLEVKENREFDFLSTKFNEMTGQLSQSREELQTMNEELEATVRERTRSIAMLLNHAGQGFLSFGRSLRIASQYSQECESIFQKSIEDLYFPELIAGTDVDQIQFYESIFEYLWNEKDPKQYAVILSLLPSEIEVNARPIEIKYREILSERGLVENVMVILTDIFDRKQLEHQVREEERVMRMVVKSVTQKRDLIDSLTDFEEYYRVELPEQIEHHPDLSEVLLELKRNTHTIKGNIGRFGMVKTQQNIHEFENELVLLEDTTRNKFKDFVQNYQCEALWQEDVDTLKEFLGEGFFDREQNISINRSVLIALESQVNQAFSVDEAHELKSVIKNMYFRPLNELLVKYIAYTESLAQRMEKLIHPIQFKGVDVLIDPEYFKAFSGSLVHIFRNLIDHGIESLEDRVVNDKDENGLITFFTQDVGNGIEIVIADDGQGINTNLVKRRAITLGVIDEKRAESMSNEEAVYLILHDALSTKFEVNELSGRGMGMAAIREEVKLLNGKMTIDSKAGIGTTFKIFLPYSDRMKPVHQLINA